MTARSGALSGERRVITALFCDVVGSTSIAETMDPEDWGDLVGSAFATMGEVVARFDGTVSEFGGDAVLAIFGAPTSHEDDPYRAVRAGVEMVSAIEAGDSSRSQAIEVRVGVNTGLVVAGDIAAGALNTFSALGDTLNVASRLQSIAEPGTVVISGETRRMLGSDVEVRDLGPAALKGRAAPVATFEVLSVKGADERRRGLPGLTSPMVGREAELASLLRLSELSAAGSGRVAAILGEPGVGKSRLVAELCRPLKDDRHVLRAVGHCVPFDEDLPYHLLASLVRSLAGVRSSESPDVLATAIEALAEASGSADRRETLLRVVGLEPSVEGGASPESSVEDYVDATVAVLTGLASDHSHVVLVCEDVHWADASSVEVMTRLLAAVPSLPLLVVIAMRPDRRSVGWGLLEAARRELAESFVEITLNALEDRDSRSLLAHLLAVESLPSALRRAITEKAEGNPFFLEEVVRMLIERDLVEQADGRWVARAHAAELDVPDSVQGLLASRIDMLDPAVRRAGRVGAVIGREVPSGLFDEVYGGRGTAGLHPHLAALQVHGILQVAGTSPELVLAFRHALIHDVMYEGLLRRERRELHAAVAEAIERRQPDRRDEMAPVLARHLELSGQAERATRYAFVAAERSLAQGARVEAARFFGQAQRLLEVTPTAAPADLVDAVLGRLTAGMGFVPGPDALAWISSVMPVAEQLDDPDRLASLYERAIWTRSMQGETYASPEYRAWLDAGYALVPRLTRPGTAARLSAMMATAQRSGDEFAASIEPFTQAVDGLTAAGDLASASYNASMLAESLSQLGRFAEAGVAVDLAADLADRSRDPNALLDADIVRGSIAADQGELDEAMRYTRRGMETAESVGNTFCDLAGNLRIADQHLRLGEVETAIVHLERSTGLAQYCNAGGYEALAHAWLAAARARLGDAQLEEFDAPLASAIASRSRSTEGLVRLQRAITLSAMGDPDRAAPDFERAIELFADYGGLPNLARAHGAFAQALQAAGQTAAADEHAQIAEGLFSDLGIQPDTAGTSGSMSRAQTPI